MRFPSCTAVRIFVRAAEQLADLVVKAHTHVRVKVRVNQYRRDQVHQLPVLAGELVGRRISCDSCTVTSRPTNQREDQLLGVVDQLLSSLRARMDLSLDLVVAVNSRRTCDRSRTILA